MWPGSLPVIPGFDCAAASLPARGVGGDFYDCFPLAESRWALLLGDASGKGVAAGLVASAVQARVHTAATLAHLGPEALMAAIDKDVHATTDGARYATAIYGVLDASQHRLTLVNAGHPSVLVLPPGTGEALRLDATGPALGLIESGLFRSHGVPLDSGSVLVAVTDGVYDALDQEGAEFGDAKLAEVLRDLRHRSAAELCKAILDAVRAHRGSRQDQDDVTAMVVKAR
jgi:sigma-B regulation protein RsbU (phosphoserine phosphatase)